MLDDLSQKLESVFKKLRGYGKLTEKNITDSMKEIRRALLEADVNYKIVKDFVASPLDFLSHMVISGKPFPVEIYKVVPKHLFYLDNEKGFSRREELQE